MTTPEILHTKLLEFEHPWTRPERRTTVAEGICRDARRLLESEYGLKGDFAQPEPPPGPGHRGRILAAVGGFLKGHACSRARRRNGNLTRRL